VSNVNNLSEIVEYLISNEIIKYDKKHNFYYTAPLQIPISLGLDDVAILQNKNICRSRLDVDTRSEVFRGVFLDIPLLASNMSSVVNSNFCIKLYDLGALGVMHRALPENELVEEVQKISERCNVSCASIGIGSDQFNLAKKLINHGATVIFIDVAHGYSDFVIDLGRKIKREFSDIKVVVGNTINPDMMFEVDDFADAVKVGIANGFVCKTKNTAACNEKQFTSVIKFKDISKKLGLPIISDGGIREAADFTKAIGAGANSVMAGSVFARCPESAAETVEIEGVRKRVYAGMASRMVQNEWKSGVKSGTCTEGKVKYLNMGEPLKDLVNRYAGALRSGITYGGANNIPDFQKFAKFVRVR